jgi:hypothetical protein
VAAPEARDIKNRIILFFNNILQPDPIVKPSGKIRPLNIVRSNIMSKKGKNTIEDFEASDKRKKIRLKKYKRPDFKGLNRS